MVNKKFLLGILVLALVFGMTVVGCSEEEDSPSPPKPGDTASNPIARVESGDLGDMTLADSGWQTLLASINSTGKYINLDLSACTMTGTSFDPVTSVATGKVRIVSIVLPNAAESIAEGLLTTGAFRGFTSLKSISGANITTIGSYGLSGTPLLSVSLPKVVTIGAHAFSSTELTTLNFPEATTIGNGAFYNCDGLTTLNIPKVTSIGTHSSIGSDVFSVYGNALTITMGTTAPTLETRLCGAAYVGRTRTVNIKVPVGATGYTPAASPFTGTTVTVTGDNTDANWANGFRGAGWNGTTFYDSSYGYRDINQNITLTISQSQ